MAIDKDVSRGHEVINNSVWAWTKERFKNGDNNNVERIIKEEVSLDYVKRVLEEDIAEKTLEVDKQYSETEKDIKKTTKRIKDLINQRSYLEFKEYIKTEEFKKFKAFAQMKHNKIDITDMLIAAGIKDAYDKFESKVNAEEFKQHFITYTDEDNLNKLKAQLDRLSQMKSEISTWRKQFVDIKEYLE